MFRRDSVALVITSNAVPAPDLNQHGLTGSWYEPSTSGQGLEVEVFPNLSPEAGSPRSAGSPTIPPPAEQDHQRWYTLSGPVVTGQPNASLTIYQNTGGNFNAPPITTAQAGRDRDVELCHVHQRSSLRTASPTARAAWGTSR